MQFDCILRKLLTLVSITACVEGFLIPVHNVPTTNPHVFRSEESALFSSPVATRSGGSDSEVESSSSFLSIRYERTGWMHKVLDWALSSPIWKYVLVPMARQKIVDTAEANGIPWLECRAWLESQTNAPWNSTFLKNSDGFDAVPIPEWYRNAAYHGYETGHLSWQAAIELELAGAAIGARNIPEAGKDGEIVFRNKFTNGLQQAGAHVPNDATIVDLGCGTGTSTRGLASLYPQAKSILGYDLSPYFIGVARFLMTLAPLSERNSIGGQWVRPIARDDRITYTVANAVDTGLPDHSVDVVNVQFVVHELPISVTLEILDEAHRILKPNGQLWFCEMDFQAPAYAAQRKNPFLFGLIRSTEPFLDEYADGQEEIWNRFAQKYKNTVIVPATGRHFAAVATKQDADVPGIIHDLRFDSNGMYKVNCTHLNVWENKKN
jgi:ubiquinone/menaquinone biosynthesis C-methylase UbiE